MMMMQVVEFLTNHRPDVAADALHALNGWLGIGAITLVSLARDAPALFEALCRTVANPSSVPVEVVIRACEVLTRLAGTNGRGMTVLPRLRLNLADHRLDCTTPCRAPLV